MTSDEQRNRDYYEEFWADHSDVYENHPTSRHRRRFVLRSLAREGVGAGSRVFDYGCGSGRLLKDIVDRFGVDAGDVSGCDITGEAIERARSAFGAENFLLGAYPEFEERFDVVTCTEVIEHSADYAKILEWIYAHLKPGGLLVLTTPSVPMDPPDVSYGHVQHFDIDALAKEMQEIGFTVEHARRWGFPLFTVQKIVTNLFFDQVNAMVVRKPMTAAKKLLFDVVYSAYMMHDWIPHGPQIFLRARRSRG